MMKRTLKLFIALLSVCLCAGFILLSAFYRREAEVLVLCYHHIDDVGNDSTIVTPETFDSQLSSLISHGYSPISVKDMIDFVYGGKQIPYRSFCVTFDDGYESNVTLGLPILEKYGVPATVCVIGVFAGCDSYKDTGKPMIPHMSLELAKSVSEGGLLNFGSHSYDMHGYAPCEEGFFRPTAARLEGETEAEFYAAFLADHEAMCALMRTKLGCTPEVFAYPHGVWDGISEEILRNSGVKVTFTTAAKKNILRKGDSDCLYLLGRYSVCETTDIEAILECNIHGNQGETK